MIHAVAVMIDCEKCQIVFKPFCVEAENGQASNCFLTHLMAVCPECGHQMIVSINVIQTEYVEKTDENKEEMDTYLHDLNLLDKEDHLQESGEE
jgi:hypothetical protein